MKASERISGLLSRITQSDTPVSGSTLAKEFNVSRQIIVKDIAWLKEHGNNIIATTRGYMVYSPPMPERVVKVVHDDDETEKELLAIVKAGATVVNVFVWHKVYGKISAPLNIKTEADVKEYMSSLKNGRSSPLKNVTNQYHYHLISAESDDALNRAEQALDKLGFLVEEDYQ